MIIGGGDPVRTVRVGTDAANVEASSVRAGTGTANVQVWTAFPGYQDTFNRGNGTLGASWFTTGVSPKVSSNRAVSGDGNGMALWRQAVPRDDVTVTATIGAVTDAAQPFQLIAGATLDDAAGEPNVYVGFQVQGSGSAVIWTRDGGTWTNRVFGNAVIRAGSVVTLTRTGNLHQGSVDGDVIASWTGDTPRGEGHRHAGFGIRSFFTGGFFGQWQYGPEADTWSAR